MEEYKVIITPQAKEHLIQIKDYISINLLSPDTAKNILKLLRKKIKDLSYLPERNPLISEIPWNSRGVRKLIVKIIMFIILFLRIKK